MIFIYKKISARQILKDAKDAKKKVAEWFKANPKRKNCKAEMWYGKVVIIHPNSIDSDIDAAAEAAIRGDK